MGALAFRGPSACRPRLRTRLFSFFLFAPVSKSPADRRTPPFLLELTGFKMAVAFYLFCFMSLPLCVVTQLFAISPSQTSLYCNPNPSAQPT